MNNRLHVTPAVAAHCRAVADMAVRIGEALNHAGVSLNLGLIRAAALVHDLTRGEPDHARRGAKLLQDLDMPQIAAIVATRMDMTLDRESRSVRPRWCFWRTSWCGRTAS